MGMIEKKLSELGIEVPSVTLNPNLLFVPAVIVNNLLYTAGAVPVPGIASASTPGTSAPIWMWPRPGRLRGSAPSTLSVSSSTASATSIG